jgi:fluoride ion exporter CrcB/FEX
VWRVAETRVIAKATLGMSRSLVGICGGFTTFSSFSLQTLVLARRFLFRGCTPAKFHGSSSWTA